MSFNPEAFLGQTVSEALDTQLVPVPEGIHSAQIKSLNLRKLDATSEKEERVILEVTWIALSKEAREATGLENPQVRQTIWLDTNPSGGLDTGKGKNVGLGRLREAVGQNRAGKSWSFNHLNGALADILVKHRPGRDGDENTYAEVARVTESGKADTAPTPKGKKAA
jgi:hypothetical protein